MNSIVRNTSFLASVFCSAIILGLIVLVDIGEGACADEKAVADGKIVARAKFVETNFDFGTVAQGTIVSHTFSFKNIGNANLQIQRLVSGCGCTAASSSMQAIAPGESGTIKIDFNTDGFSGAKNKSVQVYSNDFDNPEIRLSLSGLVESDVTLTPARILFEDIVRGAEVAPQEFTVKIRPESGKKVSSVTSYSKFLKVEKIGPAKVDSSDLKSANSTSTGDAIYKVSVDRSISVGELRDRIIINIAKGSESSSVTLPVIGKVTGAVFLEPQQVSFGIVEGNNKLERTVKLKNKGSTPIEITSISSDTRSVVPSYKVIEAGKNYLINISLDPAQVTSDLRALIEIKTSSIDEPSIYLSVFGVLPPKLDF